MHLTVNSTFSKRGLNVGCWYHGNKQAYYGDGTAMRAEKSDLSAVI